MICEGMYVNDSCHPNIYLMLAKISKLRYVAFAYSYIISVFTQKAIFFEYVRRADMHVE